MTAIKLAWSFEKKLDISIIPVLFYHHEKFEKEMR